MLRSETAANRPRMQAALAGLRAYQEAPRAAPPPLMPVIAEASGAMLRDYCGEGPPLLVLPSLINPPNVLDLAQGNSLLRWLADQGNHVLLLDWGDDSQSRREMSVADHVARIIVPLARSLGEPPVLAGYCLGGTMAFAAAALMPVRALALIAAPWRFAGFGDEARKALLDLWAGARPTTEALGVLPMEALQSAFWSLDPTRTIAKFERFAGLDPESAEACAFITLEDWANDGPPIPAAAAREMFEDFFRDDLPGLGRWIADPQSIDVPILNIVSTTDRIVPADSAADVGERLDLALGHVGMIVGSRAREALWQPLARWLSRVRAP